MAQLGLRLRPGDDGWRLALTGELASDAGNLLAESRGPLRRKPIFVFNGPYAAEREDLPAHVQALIRGPAILFEKNIPWSVGNNEVLRAYALCDRLAVQCDGVVFDPQDDKIVFPDLPETIARRRPVLVLVRQLTLEGSSQGDIVMVATRPLEWASPVRRAWRW